MKRYAYRTSFTYDGKRYTVTANSEEELNRKKYNRIRDLDDGKVTICSTMPVKEWIAQCIQIYKPNCSQQTRSDMLYRLNRHVSGKIGSMQIKAVKPAHLQMILNEQESTSFSHLTKLRQEMKFIFQKAVENELINKNPAKNLILPKNSKGTNRSLTSAEEKTFLAVCSDDPGLLLFEMMYYCGCRPAEAIKAIGKDLEVVDGSPQLHIRGTKTASADRLVPVPAVFYEKIKNTPPFAPIAPNRAGNVHTDSSYNRAVEHLKRSMNIKMGCKVYRNQLQPPFPLADDFVPYCLRHTYCTNLAKSGVDVRTAQRLMGHANIQITANIYTHIDQSQIIAAADLINQFHGGCVTQCVTRPPKAHG